MEDYRMIITPKELNQQKKDLLIVDIRPSKQRNEIPLNGLNSISCENDEVSNIQEKKVLVCQYGIVTEGLIIENDLPNTFSLLGGAESWNEFKKEQKDLSQWSRQTVLPEIGIEGQKKILNANISIVGMGGLGCPAAQSLLIAGIGSLHLIDNDTVSLSNLHRQPLFNPEDIDHKKVIVAKKKLSRMNPKANIKITDSLLDEKNAHTLLSGSDVIIDATDNIKSRQLIDRISKELNTPMIYGGLYRFEGQVSVFNVDGSPGYAELFPDSSYGGDSCADAGVLGVLPAIIGNIQALETLKLIIGIEPILIGKILIYDGMDHTTKTIHL
jgi:adenylyltransferase/sulfurtransferase|tara:strand:+ start:1223 stop:2203 length:981 start_codon:yes stop_codon:yes gene_type:complete